MRSLRTAACIPSSFLGLAMSAQNLIGNSSFEEYSVTCFSGLSYQVLLDWTKPDCGYGWDLCHACVNSTQPSAGIPANYFGWEQTHSGDAYGVIIPFTGYVDGGNVKYYATIGFSSPLVAGTEYCLRFYLSQADSAAYTTAVLHAFLWYDVPSTCGYADTAWDTFAAATFDLSPVDTSGWTLMETSITAQGGETTLTLGSFLYGAEIDTTFLGPEYPLLMAVYYIDDVYFGSCDVAVSEQVTTEDLVIFPDPIGVGEPLSIRWNDHSGAMDWELLDLEVRSVESGSTALTSGQVNIRFNSVTPGVYLLRLQSAGTRLTRRLVIR